MRFDLVRYCLMSDGDGHTWAIPVEWRNAFERYIADCECGEEIFHEPSYAHRVEGGLLTFTQPQLDGKDIG